MAQPKWTTLLIAALCVVTARAQATPTAGLQRMLEESGRFPPGARVLAAHEEGGVLHVDLEPGQPCALEQVEDLVSAADHVLGEGVRGVWLRVPDSEGVLRTLPELFDPPPVEDKGQALRSHPADHPGDGGGVLAGKTIYLSQCHGWYWHDDYEDWYTQRPNLFDTVEDFHNPEGMNQYLMRYLLNAGAHVMPVRDPDLNGDMVIVDDGSSGYAESGAWEDSVQAGFATGQAPYAYGTDPFELGGNRYAVAESKATATAIWTPDIPADGYYHVYVSYSQDSSRASDAHYVVHHPGDDTHVYVDQRVHGSTWVYIGRFWFYAGADTSSGSVELANDSSDAGAIVSADAVRFGGGMGDVMRGGTTSGYERWEEAAIYYTQYAGAPTSVYDTSGSGDGYDPSSRSRFADWEHEEGEDALYFSWHSNAGGGQGTSTYIYGPCAPGEGCGFTGYEGSEEFAEFIQDDVVDALTSLWQSDWSDRGVRVAYFAEVNPSNNDEMPAALIELAFHDLEEDTALLKHPQFRRDASRAMMHGMIDYFAWRDGDDPIYPPEPPTHLKVVADGPGELRVTWEAPSHGLPLGDPATSYRVYLSLDGRSYDGGWDVSGTEAVVENVSGYEPIFLRVTAVNEAGESFPSPTQGAVPTPTETRILVVDGFDRLDRSLLLYRDAGGAVGEVTHMDLDRMNRFDFTVEHLWALAEAGVPVDTVGSEVIADGNGPGDYMLVVWMAGNEGSEDDSFSAAEQAWIASHLDGGGKLFVSGAEIGWDLDECGSADDLAFYETYLFSSMAADDADTYQVEPAPAGIFAGLGPLGFDDGTDGYYDVRYPDVLAVLPGATPALYYDGDPGMPAALASDDGQLVYLGFPFETILGAEERATLMGDALAFLIPDYVPPEWDIGDDDDDDIVVDDDDNDDDDDTGPQVTDPHDDDDDDGCGCRQSGSAAALAPPIALLASLLALRRRRP